MYVGAMHTVRARDLPRRPRWVEGGSRGRLRRTADGVLDEHAVCLDV